MIVVDASAVIVALVDDGRDGHRVRRRLATERLVAPEIIGLEVGQAIRRFEATSMITAQRAGQAIDDLRDLTLERVSHRSLLERCWSLRYNVTMYDAAYVAVAERLDVAVLTADERLANAPGCRCAFELLTSEQPLITTPK